MNQKKIIPGIVKRHPDGFGFFIPDDINIPDIYVPRHSMQNVMTNDHVMVEATKERGGDRLRGDIVRITKRTTTKVMGKLHILNETKAILKDESKSWGSDLQILIESLNQAKDGDLVEV
nr:ribonuclease R [Pseudobdellovibrionaceae bacterium]